MASWEQEITQQLQAAQEVAVRFDIPQELTDAQKQTARTNISVTATATNTSGDDYKITMNY